MAPKVYAANEIYEQLENNFDLSNPAANRTSTVTAEDILEKYKNSENPSYTDKINGFDSTNSSSMDLSKYGGKTFTNDDVLNYAKTDGSDIAGTVSLPNMSGNSINIKGSENGGKLLSRNEDGSITISNNPQSSEAQSLAPIQLKCIVLSKIMLMFSLMLVIVMVTRKGS